MDRVVMQFLPLSWCLSALSSPGGNHVLLLLLLLFTNLPDTY
jgi:hypothetical protein